MVYDALEMSYRTIKIRKDPNTPKITELIDYDAFCGVVSDDAQRAAAGSTITALELKEMIDAGKEFALIDVREQNEYEIVNIPGATLIPKDRILSGEALAEIPQDKPVVLHCKSGARSAEALAALHRAGFKDAVHVGGGVLAWVKQVDPSLPVY
jgi:adenylyltransferase/sulfurtransferase